LIPLFAIVFGRDTGIAHLAHLGGAVAGLLLTLGARTSLAAGTNPFKDFLRRKKQDRLNARFDSNRRQADDVMRRVDAILDKINEVGIENLSEEERKFLEEASEKLSRDKRHK
ncbi:MAG: DUF6576 domain-containing protein, partial [Candidatus Zixiibacteriota bacterium]